MKTIFLTLVRAILVLSGASSLEELEESELERYQRLSEHPININIANRTAMQSSGLFSTFQLQSLLRYREEYGDILSFTELSLVSGFDEEISDALKEFVTLDSPLPPGQKPHTGTSGSLMTRASIRKDSGKDAESTWGIKASLAYADKAEIYWSQRSTYGAKAVWPGTVSGAFYARRVPLKVLAGNFAARFGQGLTQWSGFSLSSLNSPAAFVKNAGGLAPTSTFSPELLGAGAEYSIGNVVISAAADFKKGFNPMANITWTTRNVSAGLTATAEKVGADLRWAIPDASIFSEVSCRYKGGLAAIGGIIWVPAYGNKVAVQARWFQPAFKKDYSGLAACFQNKWLGASAEADWHFANEAAQYKAFLQAAPALHIGPLDLKPGLRLSTRYRPASSPQWRTDLRAELEASSGPWGLDARYNLLWCRSRAWLWYTEPGYTTERLALHARFTLFKIDNWDDRIYVYECDAPGTFNVPAYYGRGWSVSLVAAAKLGRHALHARFAATQYISSKPNRLEAKLQYSMKF